MTNALQVQPSSMASDEPIPIKVICGYARTAIRQLTTVSKANHKGVVHKANRAEHFRELFDTLTFQIPL